MLASVPVNVKSLCGGMVNTAFQIGSGVALALSSAIVQAVQKGHTTNSNSASAQLSSKILQYSTGFWCCVGLAGLGLGASALGVRGKKIEGERVDEDRVFH